MKFAFGKHFTPCSMCCNNSETNMHANDQVFICVETDSRPTVLLLKSSPGHVDVRLLLEVNGAGPSVD